MSWFFIYANSFAAAFFSDDSTSFVEADNPAHALEKFAEDYKHPCGLYAAICYRDANAYHKGEKPLAKWLCHHEIIKQERTRNLSGYSYLGHGPGRFEINGEMISVDDPKSGQVIVP